LSQDQDESSKTVGVQTVRVRDGT